MICIWRSQVELLRNFIDILVSLKTMGTLSSKCHREWWTLYDTGMIKTLRNNLHNCSLIQQWNRNSQAMWMTWNTKKNVLCSASTVFSCLRMTDTHSSYAPGNTISTIRSLEALISSECQLGIMNSSLKLAPIMNSFFFCYWYAKMLQALSGCYMCMRIAKIPKDFCGCHTQDQQHWHRRTQKSNCPHTTITHTHTYTHTEVHTNTHTDTQLSLYNVQSHTTNTHASNSKHTHM